MVYLASIFFIAFSILAYRRLDWAVMFLIAALPSYLVRFRVLGLPMTVLEVMILTVFAVWFWQNRTAILGSIKHRFLKNSPPPGNIDYPFKAEIILALIVSFSGLITARFSDASLGIWKAYFFEPILMYIVVINLLARRKDKRYELILWPLLVSALGVSLLAVYQKFTGDLIANPMWAAENTRRAVSFFGYPNAVGLYLAPLALIFSGWLVSRLSFKKEDFAPGQASLENLSIFISIVLSLLAIVYAESVGALFGLAAAAIFFGLLASRKSRIAVAIVVAVAVVGISSFTSTRRAAYEYLTLNDFSGQVRKSQWDETWKMLRDGRLTTGAGLAGYQAAVAPYHHEGIWIKDIFDPDWLRKVRASAEFRQRAWQPLEIYLYPHNIVLNFWTELGISGAALFLWLIGRHIYSGLETWRASRRQGRPDYLILGAAGAMVAIAVHGAVDVPYFKNDLSVMFWLLVAIVGFAETANRKGNKSPAISGAGDSPERAA